MDKDLQKTLDFITLIDKEKNITRQTRLTGHGRFENDAEHAWHMAIMAWLLKDYANEDIDIAKTMMMCLIHDICEIEAGDTYAYDEEGKKTQSAREEQAAQHIFGSLPEEKGQELLGLFHEFEERSTPEARFARVMDNLQPFLLNTSNDGGDWAEHGVHASQVRGRQERNSEGSKILADFIDKGIDEQIHKGHLPE